jgi:hypothetical protein
MIFPAEPFGEQAAFIVNRSGFAFQLYSGRDIGARGRASVVAQRDG